MQVDISTFSTCNSNLCWMVFIAMFDYTLTSAAVVRLDVLEVAVEADHLETNILGALDTPGDLILQHYKTNKEQS